MFHNAHVYIATKLYKSKNSLLILGSTLPDIAVTKIINWDQGLHGAENTNKFFEFIKKQHPTFTNLSQGISAHNLLDDFTHNNYAKGPGYAFRNNQELTNLISKFYQLELEKSQGIAHNYIESAVDLLLLQEVSSIQETISNALNQVDKLRVSKLLSSYFHKDETQFLDALSQFFVLLTKYNLTEKSNWILLWTELEKLLSLKCAAKQNKKILLDKAAEIVKDTYKDFLSYSLIEGNKSLKRT